MKFCFAFLFALSFCSLSLAAPTALTVQTMSETPLEATYANADTVNGNSAANPEGDLFIHAKNPGGSSATVTISAQKTSKKIPGYGSLTKSDITCSLATTEECFVGPLNTEFWNSSGAVQITYGGAGSADVDIVAIRPQKP